MNKKSYSRLDRIADQIQRDLSDLIRREVKDPRLGMVTITAVEVTRELEHAKVFITVMQADAQAVEQNIKALNHAAGFLRRELGKRLHIRTNTALHFVYDESIDRGARMSALIDEAIASDTTKHQD